MYILHIFERRKWIMTWPLNWMFLQISSFHEFPSSILGYAPNLSVMQPRRAPNINHVCIINSYEYHIWSYNCSMIYHMLWIRFWLFEVQCSVSLVFVILHYLLSFMNEKAFLQGLNPRYLMYALLTRTMRYYRYYILITDKISGKEEIRTGIYWYDTFLALELV